MGRRNAGSLWIALIILIVVGWPIYQLYDLVKDKAEKHEATRLLYQVSLFQMELLNSFLLEAERSQQTSQLDVLNQAAYSANFTHERLVLAVGENKIAPLSSIPQLMNFVLRLQIGGDRPVRPEEADILKHVSNNFRQLYDSYAMLMTSSGSIVTTQNDNIKAIDSDLLHYLQLALLQ